MEIIYYHKPFSKNYNKPVDHFLFLLAVLSYSQNFGHLFLIVIAYLTWRQMFLRKLRFAARYRYISIIPSLTI